MVDYQDTSPNILEVDNLSVYFRTRRESVHAIKNISFSLKKGSILGLVGESGSGKSVTALCLAGLLNAFKSASISGNICLLRKPQTLKINQRSVHQQVSMIFQDPMNSLNPSMPIGKQIAEVFLVKEKKNKKRAYQEATDLLRQVEIQDPERVARQYPHQLSGGMCQRVMIAIALAAKPSLLIADEPTTALDVTIQAQILRLLKKLHRENRMSIIFITHDLGLVSELCHEVAIMLQGRIVERGSTKAIFADPRHPYTIGLLRSVPKLNQKERLQPMPFQSEDEHIVGGCPFYTRCESHFPLCTQGFPKEVQISSEHRVCCLNEGSVNE